MCFGFLLNELQNVQPLCLTNHDQFLKSHGHIFFFHDKNGFWFCIHNDTQTEILTKSTTCVRNNNKTFRNDNVTWRDGFSILIFNLTNDL